MFTVTEGADCLAYLDDAVGFGVLEVLDLGEIALEGASDEACDHQDNRCIQRSKPKPPNQILILITKHIQEYPILCWGIRIWTGSIGRYKPPVDTVSLLGSGRVIAVQRQVYTFKIGVDIAVVGVDDGTGLVAVADGEEPD